MRKVRKSCKIDKKKKNTKQNACSASRDDWARGAWKVKLVMCKGNKTMIYITTKQYRKPRQLTWEDVIADKIVLSDYALDKSNTTGTVTRKFEQVDQDVLDKVNVNEMIKWLKEFNVSCSNLFEKDRHELYSSFKIPKATGGFRKIDAPCEELQDKLRKLVNFINEDCGVLYHTAAFAYIKGRSILDCVKKHQKNESNWFLKTDFSGFFPSTTIDYVMRMFSMVFPLSEICKREDGYAELKKALSLAFLDGGLPQGTCASPMITNVMSIPMDHLLFNELAKRKIVYTRYADDIHISAQEMFPWKEVVKMIEGALKYFDAPFKIKPEKTHFGKKAGRSGNWNLGLMLNKDNNITIGAKKKEQFRGALCSFALDTINGKRWSIDDVHHLRGLMSYYSMIEPEYVKEAVAKQNKKWNVDIKDMFKQYMNGTL